MCMCDSQADRRKLCISGRAAERRRAESHTYTRVPIYTDTLALVYIPTYRKTCLYGYCVAVDVRERGESIYRPNFVRVRGRGG